MVIEVLKICKKEKENLINWLLEVIKVFMKIIVNVLLVYVSFIILFRELVEDICWKN